MTKRIEAHTLATLCFPDEHAEVVQADLQLAHAYFLAGLPLQCVMHASLVVELLEAQAVKNPAMFQPLAYTAVTAKPRFSTDKSLVSTTHTRSAPPTPTEKAVAAAGSASRVRTTTGSHNSHKPGGNTSARTVSASSRHPKSSARGHGSHAKSTSSLPSARSQAAQSSARPSSRQGKHFAAALDDASLGVAVDDGSDRSDDELDLIARVHTSSRHVRMSASRQPPPSRSPLDDSLLSDSVDDFDPTESNDHLEHDARLWADVLADAETARASNVYRVDPRPQALMLLARAYAQCQRWDDTAQLLDVAHQRCMQAFGSKSPHAVPILMMQAELLSVSRGAHPVAITLYVERNEVYV